MQDREALERRVAELEREVATLRGIRPRGLRKRSEAELWGLPLWEVAVGPDLDKGEVRGHARAVVAMGDLATGIIAIGGLARGVVAVGGLAVGLLGLGGLSLGVLAAVGGLAIGGLALGGGAVGVVAVGGGAAGYYACGGAATGAHVVSATERDPEAVALFDALAPGTLCPTR